MPCFWIPSFALSLRPVLKGWYIRMVTTSKLIMNLLYRNLSTNIMLAKIIQPYDCFCTNWSQMEFTCGSEISQGFQRVALMEVGFPLTLLEKQLLSNKKLECSQLLLKLHIQLSFLDL